MLCLIVVATASSDCFGNSPEQIRSLAATIRDVDERGQGHSAATGAIKKLSTFDADALPVLLEEIDQANPLSANWLLGAFESIAERSLRQGEPLPAEALERFLLDRHRNPRARRLAFEWLRQVDSTAEDRLVPGMLDDPSAEMRRDAVARLIEEAKTKADNAPEAARDLYSQALGGAVHDDQVKTIVTALETLGQDVDVQQHFGFLAQWHLIGPFDNQESKGFDIAYPPENELDLQAKYEAQPGEVGWVPIETDHDYGIVDIARDFGPHKGAVVYAAAEFQSTKSRPVQIRLGTPNAWKIWVNGKLLFAREEYHRGMSLDQYRVDAQLREGRNVLLLKICQNEMEQDWAQRYQFQLRISDHAGSAVRAVSQRSAKPSVEESGD